MNANDSLLSRTGFLHLRLVPVLFLCIQFATCPAIAQKIGASGLKKILSKQGFTGQLTGKVRFTDMGTLECNETALHVFYYEWEQSNPPGMAIHASQRLIFIADRAEYVGSYAVEDRPIKNSSQSIAFGYAKERGNLIGCNENGLPQTVLLNGEPHVLGK